MRTGQGIWPFNPTDEEWAAGWRYKCATDQGVVWIGHDESPEWERLGRWFVPANFQALVRFGPPYDLHLTYQVADAAPTMTELRILATVTAESSATWFWEHQHDRELESSRARITTRGLRRVRVEDAYRSGVLAAAHDEVDDKATRLDLDQWDELWQQAPQELTGPKRPVLDDSHYQEVAKIYRLAVEQRRPPTQAVAANWTRHPSTAARWVMEARKRGHLGPTQQGKAGEEMR